MTPILATGAAFAGSAILNYAVPYAIGAAVNWTTGQVTHQVTAFARTNVQEAVVTGCSSQAARIGGGEDTYFGSLCGRLGGLFGQHFVAPRAQAAIAPQVDQAATIAGNIAGQAAGAVLNAGFSAGATAIANAWSGPAPAANAAAATAATAAANAAAATAATAAANAAAATAATATAATAPATATPTVAQTSPDMAMMMQMMMQQQQQINQLLALVANNQTSRPATSAEIVELPSQIHQHLMLAF